MPGNAATPIIPRDGVMTLTDGTAGTPKTLTVLYTNGAIKITGLNNAQKDRKIYKSRGIIYAGRNTEDKEFGIEFTADAVHFLGDGTTATLFEAIMQKGLWSTATSTFPVSGGDIYTLQWSWTVERTNFSGTNDNVVTYKYVMFELDFAEGDPSQFSLKGTGLPYGTAATDWSTLT
jgi:hypothetical protein